MPYLTLALLVPDFSALVTVVIAGCIAQLSRRKDGLKLLFNCSQYLVTYGSAILVFRLLGGASFLDLKRLSVAEATVAGGFPMMVSYLTVFFINGLLVSSVVALSTNGRTLQVWKENISDAWA